MTNCSTNLKELSKTGVDVIMRMLIDAHVLNDVFTDQPNKAGMQGFFYGLMARTKFSKLHERQGFKFFCFSDVFPLSQCRRGGDIKVIFSSPLSSMVKEMGTYLKKCLDSGDVHQCVFNWGGWKVLITGVKVFDVPLRRDWITGSPIALRYDPERGPRSDRYFSFERQDGLHEFLERLKENAIKKYEAFTGLPAPIDDHQFLFEDLVYDKTVSIPVTIHGEEINILASKWKKLSIVKAHSKELKDFYKFLMDAGVGERNAMGFGFVNPINSRNSR